MLTNAAAPAPGAESVRPCKPWQIYMLRGQQWVPVGACGDRALAENHIRSLRKLMRGYQFDLAWEGEGDAA
ncbi:hypothetical protein IQ265_00730 [Nodosilinea sp. LEGE 06152]|uniref:hypothetical protein n=1 Tax=Nodosilinea sp. LEGE 06152 TaxID=2777966 RepID=UPI0018813A5D|nr:hypothetical protein [Nodosilinea sp. LEGE 06152]MBE9155372.1 hypothetical protein [Nodosilinea sp. LEGE 06152]